MYLAANLQFIFYVFLLIFQDCVQLNQYTLKDEIGKVNIPGARLVFHTYQGCLGYCGGNPTRFGSGRGVLGDEAGRGRVLSFMVHLFCFILFCFYIVLCFYKSSQSFQGNSISPTLVLAFFLLKALSHLFLLLY